MTITRTEAAAARAFKRDFIDAGRQWDAQTFAGRDFIIVDDADDLTATTVKGLADWLVANTRRA